MRTNLPQFRLLIEPEPFKCNPQFMPRTLRCRGEGSRVARGPGAPGAKESVMAKGQQKSNREVKKPKKEKPKGPAMPVNPFSTPLAVNQGKPKSK